jgi:hypothetical protein
MAKRSRGSQNDSAHDSNSNLVSEAFRRVTSLVDKKAEEPEDGPAMKLSEDFSHIYLFRSPELYYWSAVLLSLSRLISPQRCGVLHRPELSLPLSLGHQLHHGGSLRDRRPRLLADLDVSLLLETT